MPFATRAFGTVLPFLFILACVIEAAPPIAVQSVFDAVDLRTEISDSVTELDKLISSAEAFQANRDAVRRLSQSVALCTQCLIDSGEPFRTKSQENSVATAVGSPVSLKSAISLRNTMQKIRENASHQEASDAWMQYKVSQEEAVNDRDVDLTSERLSESISWNRLISRGESMTLMKERTDRFRKTFRKPGNPQTDSRHATIVALIVLTLHEAPEPAPDSISGKRWRELVLEVNGHFVRSAIAVKKRDSDAAEHFRLGMESCNACHQVFKR